MKDATFTADRLLALYDRVAEAEDAIPRLRRFVLDLAMRGKLVEQDPTDEPAAALLKRIAKEKARHQAKPAIHRQVSDPPAFDVPDGWAWTTLAGVSTVTMGQSPPGDTYNTNGEGVPLINGPVEFTEGPFGLTVVNQYTTAPTNFCEKGDLLICVRGSTTGRTNVAAFRACIGRGVAAIHSTFEDGFVRLFIWKARYDIIEMGRGIAFPSVSKKQIEDLAFPLPPLAEQQRIVAKVDELMALCDRLQAARAGREAVRDRLTAATLARLTAPETDDETFPTHARFALQTLPTLTTRPDQIKTLRQTILNLAVRGKLVAQDPTEEPAAEMLREFEKSKKGDRKGRDWSQGALNKVEEAFSAPPGWAWTTIDETALRVTVGYVGPMKDEYVEAGVPFLRSQNVRANRFRFEGLAKISQDFHNKIIKSVLYPGDVVVVRSGNVGTACTIPEELGEANCSDLVVIQRPKCVNPHFLCFYLNSLASVHVEAGAVGVALTHFNTKSVATMPIPVPPLAEQHRIVAKVDALMALCDQLEASLTTATTTRSRLLEALLHEALQDKEAA